jgi:type IV secretory pathway VirB2 component (pilin)
MQILNKSRKNFVRLKKAISFAVMSVITAAMSLPIYADEGGGESAWTQVVDFIGTWIPRLGGAVMFVGVVMWGLGWQSENAESKTRGIQVIIGGGIVFAAGGLAKTLMA